MRTNCMDSLDRTNVAQSTIGKVTLTRQLQALDILTAEESVEEFEDLSKVFRSSAVLLFFLLVMTCTHYCWQCGPMWVIRLPGHTPVQGR